MRLGGVDRIECRFPPLTNLGHEIVAGRGRLVAKAFAFIAVNSDTCELHKYLRRLRASLNCLTQHAH